MAQDFPPRLAGPWKHNEVYRVAEREDAAGDRIKVRYIFPDGSSAYRYVTKRADTEENIHLVGLALAANPDLRHYR